jgi:chromosome partitioning protein
MRREFVFLLNQCPPAQQTARVDEGVAALEALGGLISPLVLSRVDYQEAARQGLGVTEVHAYGAAAEEMRALWSSLKRRLSRLKGAVPSRKAA